MELKKLATALTMSVLFAGAASAETIERPDFKKFFDAVGTDGTVIVHDLKADRRFVYNPERAKTGFLPSSTFKIPNSLIALEAGAAKSVDEVFDPPASPFLINGKAILPKVCDTKVALRVAFQNSCVPVYQEIARRVGADRMAQLVRKMGYGNATIEGAAIDWFWLSGDLRITAEEQISFLEKLWRGDLPFEKTAIEQVKDIMFVEQTPKGTMRGKSGYVFSTTPEAGWQVGWVEHEGNAVLFALNLDITRPEHFAARMGIVKQVLGELR